MKSHQCHFNDAQCLDEEFIKKTNSQNSRNLPFVWNAFKVDVIIMLFSCEAGTWGSEYKDGGYECFINNGNWGWGMIQLVKDLPYQHQDLNLIPVSKMLGVVLCASNPSMGKGRDRRVPLRICSQHNLILALCQMLSHDWTPTGGPTPSLKVIHEQGANNLNGISLHSGHFYLACACKSYLAYYPWNQEFLKTIYSLVLDYIAME